MAMRAKPTHTALAPQEMASASLKSALGQNSGCTPHPLPEAHLALSFPQSHRGVIMEAPVPWWQDDFGSPGTGGSLMAPVPPDGPKTPGGVRQLLGSGMAESHGI
jgi:hypothetical protein